MTEATSWIAVVDDDPAVLKALSRLLRSHAYRARTYGSGREFLAALPAERPECLILDMQMSEMNGLELWQHLIRSGLPIPTIVITASGDAGTRERCEAAGAAAYLLKPVQDTALFVAIDKVIGKLRKA